MCDIFLKKQQKQVHLLRGHLAPVGFLEKLQIR